MINPDNPEPAAKFSPPLEKASPLKRIITLIAVVAPFCGLVAAIVLHWGHSITWVELALLLGMYIVSGAGITVGYHRLFTHRSFETIRPVKLILALMGSLAVQGPLFKWVAIHRLHHRHSDDDGDPHSPHGSGRGLWGTIAGFWHAHLGWMFTPDPPELERYTRDLQADPLLRGVSRWFALGVALSLLLPAALGGLMTGSWLGVLTGFLWGGLARVFLVHHMTWSINSVCHLWGTRRYPGRDESRNNFIMGIIALGEGWHNNHHRFPTSARHGLRWWEFDASWWIIRLMALFGLAWRVRVPVEARRA